MARKTLDAWVIEAIQQSETGGKGKISSLKLVHNKGIGIDELHTYKFEGTHTVTPKELADMFRNKAGVYAQDLDGIQMFQVWAYYGTGEPEDRINIKIVPEVDPMKNGLATEAPDATGERQQNMRHKEALIGQVYSRQQTLDNHSLRLIETQSNIIDKLQAQNFNQFELMKDLMLAMSDKQNEYQMAQIDKQRKADRENTLMKMAPALVNSFTGRKVFPQASQDTALIETIIDNLTEEQFNMLPMLGLPDTVMGPLADRFAESLKARREKESQRKALPGFRGDPEKDITGGTE